MGNGRPSVGTPENVKKLLDVGNEISEVARSGKGNTAVGRGKRGVPGDRTPDSRIGVKALKPDTSSGGGKITQAAKEDERKSGQLPKDMPERAKNRTAGDQCSSCGHLKHGYKTCPNCDQ